MAKLERSFFLRADVVLVSKQLLGKYLFTRLRPPQADYAGQARLLKQECDTDEVTGGIIVETEAYAGPEDRASHAYGNRRTKRTEIMFHEGGVAYVYLCYGMYSLFNIITNIEGIPHAVLIRAIQPTHGIETMLKRRKKNKLDRSVAGGPGALTQALGIDTSHNGVSVTGNRIWLEDRCCLVSPDEIQACPRVGVSYAGPDAKRLWRFKIRDNMWTSKTK